MTPSKAPILPEHAHTDLSHKAANLSNTHWYRSDSSRSVGDTSRPTIVYSVGDDKHPALAKLRRAKQRLYAQMADLEVAFQVAFKILMLVNRS